MQSYDRIVQPKDTPTPVIGAHFIAGTSSSCSVMYVDMTNSTTAKSDNRRRSQCHILVDKVD